MKKKNKKILMWAILIIGILGILAYFYGINTFNILSSSSVEVKEDSGGKLKWVVTGTADDIDSGYTFYYKPSIQKNSLGQTITPKDSLSLNIKTKEKSCYYRLIPKSTQTFKIRIIPYIWEKEWNFNYWVLSNAEKTFNIEIKPNKGKTRYIDGSMQNSIDIEDPDGKGILTVSTLGAFESKYDCPEKDNVAVIKGDTQDYKIVSRNTLEFDLNNLEGSNLLGNIIDIARGGGSIKRYLYRNYKQNDEFAQDFSGYPEVTDTYIKGIKDMGNPVFTIVADQDFFNSAVYTPPTSANPYIYKINAPQVEAGKKGTISVVVKNYDNTEGKVLLTLDAQYSSITPLSRNFVLDKEKTEYFSTTSQNVEENEKITAKVCTVNQMGNNKCRSKTVYRKIKKEPSPSVCGDGYCQESESETNCPEDCYDGGGGGGNNTEECQTCFSWLHNKIHPGKCTQKTYIKTKWYNPTTWILPEEGITQNMICPFVLGFYVIFILAITLILVIITKILINKKNRRKK